MDLQLTNKIAFIAASTQGIGLATAIGLAAEGCNIAICGRDTSKFSNAVEAIQSANQKVQVLATECDLARAASIESWFKTATDNLGSPDILITNTGGPPAGSWQTLTDDQWQSGVDSTLMNVVRMVRLATPHMKSQNWGRIIHITSLVAKEPNLLLPISSTLRAGLMALTRLQATELAPHGITVNGILPGHTLTDRQTHLAEVIAKQNNITPEQALKERSQEIPLGYIADPADIANPTVFLASHAARYITGVNLLVDGGLTKGMG